MRIHHLTNGILALTLALGMATAHAHDAEAAKGEAASAKQQAKASADEAKSARRVESIYLEALGGVRCPTLSTILPYVSVWRWSRSITAMYESEKWPT